MENLNPAGGDIITIEGSGFPENLDAAYELDIIMDIQTKCVPFEITYNMIKCETDPFKSDARRRLQLGGTFTMTLTASAGMTTLQ